MDGRTAAATLAERLAGLSPEKRRLLAQRNPLSFAQERLWFLDRLHGGSFFYNGALAIDLAGDLCAPALQAALSEIVRRHEVLRTAFLEVDGLPLLVVEPPAPLALPIIDLGGLDGARSEEVLARLEREQVRQPFDLNATPLLRALLVRKAGRRHALLLTTHHIAADRWSSRILASEVAALYGAFAAGVGSPLPAMPLQYSDFAVWQRSTGRGGDLEADLRYWRRQLAGAPMRLELPTDRPRPVAESFRGARVRRPLAPALCGDLRALGRRLQITEFMVLLSAFMVVLHRYGGQEDMLAGTSVDHRSRVELEGLIGLFLNTVILRTRLSGELAVGRLLEQTRQMVLAAHEHRDLPFERLVEALQPERALSGNPLFQVELNLLPAPERRLDLAGIAAEVRTVDRETAMYDLVLFVEQSDEELVAFLELNTDLFDRTTGLRLLGHFERLLAAIVEDPDRPLAALPLLPAAERHQLLTEWPRAAPGDRSGGWVQQLFEGQAATRPDAVAASRGERRVTYDGLNRTANRLARWLRAAGAGRERFVAVLGERGPDLLAAMLGIAKAGAVYVPLEPNNPDPRLEAILADCAPLVLVTQGSLAERAVRLAAALSPPARVICWDAAPPGLGLADRRDLAAQPDGNPAVATEGHDLANVFYTSGSTGRPKGAMVEHAGMRNHLWAKRELLGLDAASVVAQNASPGFDISIWQSLAPLLAGGRVVVYDDAAVGEPETFLGRVELDGVTVLETVPTLLELMLSEVPAGVRLPRLAWLISNAETLPVPLARRWHERFPHVPLVNTYGATECSDDVTHQVFREPPPPQAPRVGVGRPIAGMEVWVLDRELGPVPAGCPGQIAFTGVGLGRGYLNDPVKTARTFVPDPLTSGPGARLYRTGDLGRWGAAGDLEFLGRIDHQVKVRGLRIEPGEIEAALATHPAVREAVVAVRRDGPGPGQLVAYLVCDRGGVPRPEELRAFLRGRLPEHMVPAACVILDALPLTPNGKVDRQALPAPASEPEAEGSAAAAVPPRGPVEEMLAAIWSAVLGRERIGAHDDFFALGGHSLLAMQVMARVRSAFALEVPLRALFESPTPAGLATAVERAMKAGRAGETPPIVPVPRTGPLPASFAQQRLWFLDQLEPASPAYNLPLAVRYRGPLAPAAFAAGLAGVVRRHEALRTVLQAVDGEAVQVILPAGPVPLPVVDLEALPPDRREREVRRVLATEGLRPFDLERGPLLRTVLLRLDTGDHALLATLHHAVSDGWSMEILGREVEVLYGACRRGEPSPLPELPVQYADFAVWQRRWLAGEALADQLGYWRRQLAGAPPLLEMPTDRPRPTVRSYRGGVRRWELPPGLTGALLRLSRQRSATPFMTLLAAFQALLARYSGQTDLVVGSPVAGRTRLEIEGLIGFFVNTLALRGNLAGDPAFSALISRVRETALGAYAHQDLPFERLVEELSPERSLAYSPLYQVMFALENTPRRRAETASGLTSRSFEPEGGAAKLDLILALFEVEGRLAGGVNYSLELFDGATVERLVGHLETLLAGAVADPGQRLSCLPMLAAAERQQLLEWNATAAVSPRACCLHELVAEQVRRTPDAVAVACRGEALRYRELEASANRLAHRLRAWGVGPEVRVGVCLERSLDLVIALLGVLKAGGAYVPLDPAYPRERLAFTLEDAAAPVLLTQESLLGLLPEAPAGGGLRVALLDRLGEVLAQEPAEAPHSGVEPANLAYLIYTSGSTGRPKAVAIQHQSAAVLVHWARQVFSGEELAGVLASTSICFDLSVFELFVPLCHGGRVILAGNALELAGLPATPSVTLVNTVPSAIAELLRLEALPGSLRTINLAGEPLQQGLVRELYRCPSVDRVVNLYGPSEGTTYSTFTVVPRGAVPTIGRPVSGTRAHVLGPDLSPCPAGVPGDLHLAGLGLARGYLNRPELTAARFVPDPFCEEPGGRLYRTGDLVRHRLDGELEFLGRVDHQVKIRGFRIEPGEIEALLNGHPAVREAVVVPRLEEPGGGRLVAYVVPAEAGLETSELRRFLAERLPGFMVPATFVTLAGLPLTPNGKVDRRALPAPEPSAAVREGASEAPRTAAEEVVAGIWEQVLRIAPVGRQDSFFEIGGHSLLATRVLSRIREAFGVEIPLRRLFEEPTLAGLAGAVEAALRTRDGVRASPSIERLPRPSELPLSFAQQRIWFVEQLAPGSPAYTLSGAVRMRGSLEVEVLEQSFAEIVRRHEVLRARFTEVEGRPVQSLAPSPGSSLPVVDLAHLPAGGGEQAVRRLIAAEAMRSFDLGRGPLLRLILLRLGEREHVLVLSMHHIVSDAWSLQVLLDELRILYPALAAGRPSPLPELPVQYADFAAWQRRWLFGEVLEWHLAYWRLKLAGLRPLLVPTDHPRPSAGAQGGDLRRLHLSPGLRESLGELGRREGATLFMTLLAGFGVVLHGLTGEEDVTVGADIANRTRGETEGMIGFFINMLVLRTNLSRNPTFRQLLARVRETALGAYAHQDLPFERLVEELQPERRSGHSPLFQVVFNFNNTREAGRANGIGSLGPVMLEPVEVERVTVRFELALLMREVPEGLEALWLFDRGLFEGATIERMHRRLEAVLEAAAADPEARLSRLLEAGDRERWQREVGEREAGRRRKLRQVKAVPVRVQPAGVAAD